MGPDIPNEAAHRVKVAGAEGMDRNIMQMFLDFLYEHNPYAIQFKSAYEILKRKETVTIRLKSIQPTAYMASGHDIRTYVRPSSTEVAMVIGNDGEIGSGERDIILTSTSNKWERISDLHTGYLPMRYPLLFPYGQQGYDSYYKVPTPNSEYSNI
jgi:hypothetical protein